MAIGLYQNKAEFDYRIGDLVRRYTAVQAEIRSVKTWLDGQPDADLIAKYGYTSTEVAQIKSAFHDLDDHAAVFQHTAPVNLLPYDYMTFAKQLLGPG